MNVKVSESFDSNRKMDLVNNEIGIRVGEARKVEDARSIIRAVGVMAAGLIGVALAVGTVGVIAAVDGIEPDQYDAGNRFALGVLAILLVLSFPVAMAILFFIARINDLSILWSLILSSLALAAVGAFVVVFGAM